MNVGKIGEIQVKKEKSERKMIIVLKKSKGLPCVKVIDQVLCFQWTNLKNWIKFTER